MLYFGRGCRNPIPVLITVKWSLTGSEKQKNISNFELQMWSQSLMRGTKHSDYGILENWSLRRGGRN